LGLPDGEETMPLAFFVLTQYRRVTDGQTDGRTRCDHYYPRKHSVARVKMSTVRFRIEYQNGLSLLADRT